MKNFSIICYIFSILGLIYLHYTYPKHYTKKYCVGIFVSGYITGQFYAFFKKTYTPGERMDRDYDPINIFGVGLH